MTQESFKFSFKRVVPRDHKITSQMKDDIKTVISIFRGGHCCFESCALTISRKNVKSESTEVAGGYIVKTVKLVSPIDCSSILAGGRRNNTKG